MKVNRMETVTVDAMPSIIVQSNLPMVEQISCPSLNQPSRHTDSVPTPADRSYCPSSGSQIMNPGHRLDVSSKITFSKDAIAMDIFSRDTFSKDYSRDGDEDKQTDMELCCTLPGSQMSKDSRADMHTSPLRWLTPLRRPTVRMRTRPQRQTRSCATLSHAPRCPRKAGRTGTSAPLLTALTGNSSMKRYTYTWNSE